MTLKRPPSPEQLLALFEAAIKDCPEFPFEGAFSEQEIRWLGRADALLEASGSIAALLDFRTARSNLGSFTHSRDKLLIPLHVAYSRIELTVPAAGQGAFIPGGDTWNGYAALVRLFQVECDDLLVVDPYLSAVLFTELAPHSTARVSLRCLAVQRGEYHPGLVAAATKWAQDGASVDHPVEVRYASPGALHDRLIIADGKSVWLISQSLKDIAKKSPASVTRAEGELAELKVAHYNDLWETCTPLV